MAFERVGVQLELKDYQKFVRGLQQASKATQTFVSNFTAGMARAQQAARPTKIVNALQTMQKQIAALAKSAELKRGAGFPEFVTEIEKHAERLQQVTAKRLAAFEAGISKMRFADMGLARKAFVSFFEETALASGVWSEEVAKNFERVQIAQMQAAESTGEAASVIGGMGGAFKAGSAATIALGVAVGTVLVTALKAAVEITGKIISKVKELTVSFAKAAAGLIETAATTAGRFNEMELAAIATGRGIGLTDEAVLGAIKSVNAMNIRYDVAAASVMRMARVQIDLKYATDLVRIAQAMAVETQRDSSEEMTSLTHALTTNNVQMLRRHGIIIDNDKAERDFAKANDLVVGSLTARQKIEAQVQAVIKESTHLMGVYEAALRSGSKIMRSIEGRLIPEFVAALGAPMQGAFAEVAQSMFDFLTALRASITEGGRFYPTMVKIGAVLQIVGEHLSNFTDKLTGFFKAQVSNVRELEETMGMVDVIDTAADEMNQSMSDMAIAAFEWGAEIMAQFARGLAAGLRFVGEAMLLVAKVLSTWLASFSPPKVAPDIAKWGAAAMAEYLRGFAMVDYSAFEGIQKVLGRLLGGPRLAGLLGEVIEAMATGTVGEDLFGRIAAATGAYGAEIVKLTKLQFKYAEALRAVTAAQLALTRAQEAVKGHSLEVDKLVREYNKLLKAGAGDEILDTKLAEINMSERARNVAIIERDEAQVAVKLAEARLDPIKEALALQEKLVDVLLDLAAAQADVVEKTKKAAKGGADAIIEEFGRAGARIGDEFKTNMQKAIDKIKDTIAARLKGIFQPVWDAWFGKLVQTIPSAVLGGGVPPTAEFVPGVAQAFEGVVSAFGPLSEALKLFVDTVVEKGLIETLKEWPGPMGLLATAISDVDWVTLVEALNAMTEAIKSIRESKVLGLLFNPTQEEREAIRAAVTVYGGGGAFRDMSEEERGAWWGNVPTSEQAPAPPFSGDPFNIIGARAGGGVLGGLLDFFAGEGTASLRAAILDFLGRAIELGSPAYAMVPIGVSIAEGIALGMPEGMPFIFTAMEDIAAEMLAAAGPEAKTSLSKTLWLVGKAFNVMIAKGIKDNVGVIIGAMDEAMRRAKEWIAQSGYEAGRSGGLGGDSQQQGGYSPRGGIHHPGEYIIPAGLTRALMQPVSRTSNVQIGPNNISQGIDEAYFMARVRNMIRREVASAH